MRRLLFEPAFPIDARIRRVTVDGSPAKYEIARAGDVQRARVVVDAAHPTTEVAFIYDEGTDVFVEPRAIRTGAANDGLRLLRVRPENGALHLTAEGRAGRAYTIIVRTPHRLGAAEGIAVVEPNGRDQRVEIRFNASTDEYVRRQIAIPFVR